MEIGEAIGIFPSETISNWNLTRIGYLRVLVWENSDMRGGSFRGTIGIELDSAIGLRLRRTPSEARELFRGTRKRQNISLQENLILHAFYLRQ